MPRPSHLVICKSVLLFCQEIYLVLGLHHRKACVMGDEMFDFLKDVVANAPDLAAEDESAKPKRRRLDDGVNPYLWCVTRHHHCFDKQEDGRY